MHLQDWIAYPLLASVLACVVVIWLALVRERRRLWEEHGTTRSHTSGGRDARGAPMSRASWDEYFMNIAREVSTRSTCDRKFVGAVIVRDKSILATGYNGSIRELPHCDEEGHLMEDGHCVRTVHAEANAIVQAARNGVRIDTATIYVTASPCWGCFQLIANAGILRIVSVRSTGTRASSRTARDLA